MIWYSQNPDWKTWQAVPLVSGRVDRSRLTSDGDGRWSVFRGLLGDTNATRCLPGGAYRADIYVNGRREATASLTTASPPFAPAAYRDMNVAMCRVEGWEAWKPADGALVRGYRQTDAGRGAFLLTYYLPRGVGLSRGAAERAAATLAARGLLPNSTLPPALESCTPSPGGAEYDRGPETSLMSRTWREPSGLVHVGVVFHRRAESPDAEAALTDQDCATLQSFSSIR